MERRLILVLGAVLSLLLATSARADQASCESLFVPFKFQTSKIVESDRFVTGRGLLEYSHTLSERFSRALNELGPNETWIDFGAGKAIAAEDYLTSAPVHQKANVVAITYRYTRWLPKYRGPKLRILKDRFFEEIVSLPRFHLGSDLFGIFSYTNHIDHYFAVVLRDLETGGMHFIHGDFHRTVVSKKNGERVDVASWLEVASGQKVESLKNGVMILTKLTDTFNIPRLRLIKTDDQVPPGRVFEEY